MGNLDGSFTRTLKNGTTIEYDANGLMTSRVDRNGNTTSYAYDAGDNLTTITDPVGLMTTLAYTGGLLTSVTDPAGRVTNFAHDGAGDLVSITDPDLSVRQFAYDGSHRLTSQTSKRNFVSAYQYGFHGRNTRADRPDTSFVLVAPSQAVGLIDAGAGLGTAANPAPFTRPEDVVATFTDGNGNVTSFETDKFGAATSVVDALTRTTVTTRDGDSQATQITRPNGRVDSFTYDGNGNLLTLAEAVGDPLLERTTTFEYEQLFNKVTKITDPALNETLFAYDANGNLTGTTDALGKVRTFTYDSRGLMLTHTDENNKSTSLSYDVNGNVSNVTDAENDISQLVYDTSGNITSIAKGVGTLEERVVNYSYDLNNRPTVVTDSTGAVTQITYDTAGNPVQLGLPGGQIRFLNYDSLNRTIQVNDPITGISNTAYDANGKAISFTDALGNLTGFEYDAGNRLTKQVDALLNERIFAYDDEDNLTSVTDGRGNTTSFTYDLLNRVTGRTNPVMESASFTYDSRDNPVTATDPKSQVTTNSYDALNRLTQILTPDNLIGLGYDPVGNVTSVSDDDSDLAFSYDGLNRVVTASTGLGGMQPLVLLANTYDAVGNRIELADDAGLAGAVTGFGYDGVGRLTRLTTPAGQPIDLAYDPAGRVTGITFPNAVTSTFQYDMATGRLSQVTHAVGAVQLADLVYGYNGVGNIASIAEIGQTRNFTYDDLQRLTAGGTAAAPESYAYDPEGNRTASHLSASHVTDTANRLTEDDQFCYAHDLNGNLETKTAKVAGACTGGVTTYTYDAQNKLIRIDFADLTFAAYRYDGLGRRIEKDVNGTVTRYVYDGAHILLEYDGLDNLLARYSHGVRADDLPLTIERSGQSFYYHADRQGSVRKITDGAGLVVNSYDYDAYGNIETSVEGVANPFTYTGREFDAESGLYFYRTRYYDPATGRFLQKDPIGFQSQDLNLYRYVFNSPTNVRDPDGLQGVTFTPFGPVPLPIFPGNQNQQELYDKGALELQEMLSEAKDKIGDILDPEKQKDPEVKEKLKGLQPPEEMFEGTEEPIEDMKPLDPNDCFAVLVSCLKQHKDSPLCQGPFGAAAEAAWIGICYSVYIGCMALPGPGDYPY